MTPDPFERRHRRARALLLLVEVLHYVVGVFGVLACLPLLLGGLSDLLGRVGQWGVVAWHDVDRCLTGLAVLAYGILTLRSASLMGRRKHRRFSAWWALAHVPTVLALPLALLTWLVLSRPPVKELYESRVLPFEPVVRPPPLPVPVIPLEPAAAATRDPATS